MRRLLKRFVSGLAAVGLLATLLTGCGGGGTPDQPTVGPTDMGEITYTAPEEENIEEDVTSEGSYFVNNEILLTGVENATKDELAALVRPYGGTIVGYIELTNDCQIRFNQVHTIDELQNIVDELKLNEKVEDASIHSLMETTSDAIPDDSEWASEEWSATYPEGKNWGMEAIDAMGAWDYRSQMQDVRVGIIDTMFDTNHEDLNPSDSESRFVQVWNNPTDLAAESEDDGPEHGTHVAGIIAAEYNNGKGVAGVAPTAKLYAYSIKGQSTDSTVAEHSDLSGYMEWKYALAKLITSKCRVINVSMGLEYPSTKFSQQQAQIYGPYLKKMLDKGYDFLIVQAAGNTPKGQILPSNATKNGIFCGITDEEVVKHIMVVGNMKSKGSHQQHFLSWVGDRVFDGYALSFTSFYGDRVDVFAPGTGIWSTIPNGYDYKSGTSMAAPHVTGVAADCFAVNPSLTAEQVKNIIVSNYSCQITDKDTDHIFQGGFWKTYPVLNAKLSVEAALHATGDLDTPSNPENAVVLGHVYDAKEGSVLKDVSVSAYCTSASDDDTSAFVTSDQSDDEGGFTLVLAPGSYVISLYKEGYQQFAYADVTVSESETKYLDLAMMVMHSSNSAELDGNVINAITGSNVSGVTVKVRPGWNCQTGSLAQVFGEDRDAVTVTNSSGHYSIDLEAGTYTVEFSKEGFVTGYVNAYCIEGACTSKDGSITPVLDENEYRIVLTWGENPWDLDSHLSGPLDEYGDRFHVYYSHRSATASTEDGNVTVAQLDHDDMSSYGPETITLIKLSNDSVYHYAVHDFTNRSSSESKALSMSGAKVVVYHGNSVIATFNVPIDKVGTAWNVFDIQGNQLIPVNTMDNISNSSQVTMQDATSTYALYADEEDEEKVETFEEDPVDEEYLAELAALDMPVEGPIELD